jgi:hypothetical protein
LGKFHWDISPDEPDQRGKLRPPFLMKAFHGSIWIRQQCTCHQFLFASVHT